MRYCIFCEDRATSKEDAWPLWLMRRLGATEAGIVEAQRGKQKSNTWKSGKAGPKVRFVCASCNNGWLSRLENRVKPIIEGLFDEESVTLECSDQKTLVAWGVKNAMVHEALRLAYPLKTSFDRKRGRKDGKTTCTGYFFYPQVIIA